MGSDLTRARTVHQEVFERSRTRCFRGDFVRQLLQTSHLLLTSRLPEPVTEAAVRCPAVAGPTLLCLGYVAPPCSGLIFTPPRARLAGSVPVYATRS